MTRFIVCSVPSVDYGGMTPFTFVNHPINIDVVTKIRKAQYTTYGNSIGNPSIEFDFLGDTKAAEWRFPIRTRVEVKENKTYGSAFYGRMQGVDVVVTDDRDAEIEKILKEFGANVTITS